MNCFNKTMAIFLSWFGRFNSVLQEHIKEQLVEKTSDTTWKKKPIYILQKQIQFCLFFETANQAFLKLLCILSI